MPAIWVGALLVLGGLLTLVAPSIWRRHVSGRQPRPTAESVAQERREFEFDTDPEGAWPGIALIAMGVILLLAGTFA